MHVANPLEEPAEMALLMEQGTSGLRGVGMDDRRPSVLYDEHGQTLVEYALVVSVFLLLTLGIMEFGRLVFTYNTLANAAREGARYGVMHPGDTAGVTTAVHSLTSGLDGVLLGVQVTWTDDSVQTRVTYPVDLLSGLVIQAIGGTSTITLQAASTMRLE